MTEEKQGPAADAPSEHTIIRQAAAQQLATQLATSTSLIALCEELARTRKADRIAPIFAAARVMAASAGVTRALTHAAMGETRHRSIVETPSPADRVREARLAYNKKNLHDAEVREKFARRMDELVEQSIRARTGQSTERDVFAEDIERNAQAIERLKKAVAEDE